MNNIRKPTVAGMFYTNEKKSLEKEMKDSFLSKFGPGKLSDVNEKKNHLKGVIVPHAGFSFSGGTAAFSYNEIRKNGLADVYIVLGPNHNHYGSGIAMPTGGMWQTPLGDIPIDQELVDTLKGGIIDADDQTMNARENSIEVQLPFLQYISQDHTFSLVPIAMAMQDYDTAYDVGCELFESINNDKRNIIIIASSDFSHEGIAYGKIPPLENVHEFVEQQDRLALDQILHFQPKKLIDTIYSHNITMCGFGPVAAMLTATKKLGANHVELLKYSTSYDVHPDNSACVGYASCAVY